MLYTSISDSNTLVTKFSKMYSPLDPVILCLFPSLFISLVYYIYNKLVSYHFYCTTIDDIFVYRPYIIYIYIYIYIYNTITQDTILYHSILANYRSISQLSSMSKTLEQVVSSHLIHYITSNNIVDYFQSSYLPHHSNETAPKSYYW